MPPSISTCTRWMPHRHPDSLVRRRRPNRPAPRSRPRPEHTERPTDIPGVDLQRSDDRRRASRRRAPGVAGLHPRLRRQDRRSCAGRFIPFRIPASRATRRGRRTRGLTAAAPTTGPAWRWTRHAESSTSRPGLRRLISTAPIASATTSMQTACSRSTRAPGKRIWHFQFVRHDIWDRDPPSPPSLVTRAAQRPDDRCGRADHEAGIRVRVRSHERQAALPDRVSALSRERRAW